MGTPRDPNSPRTLLVPLDGTEFSRSILTQVRELFAPDRFRIAILHVAGLPTGAAGPYRPAAVGPNYTLYAYDQTRGGIAEGDRASYQRHAIYAGHAQSEYRARLEKELERELTLVREHGYQASATVHFGDPVTEIVAFAQSASVAAIAMATHGRTGIGRVLQGSVAQDVFARLERAVPVLLVRPGDPSAGDEAGTIPGGGAPEAEPEP